LSRFTLEEIALIAELEESEIKIILQGLIKENILTVHDNNYIYNNVEKDAKVRKRLPLMFEYHSPETIEMIVKCFCAEIEVNKIIKILEPQKNCINKFFAYFREQIYEQQLQELNKYLKENPCVPRERDYMGKKIYLYLYKHKLFVSKNFLKAVNVQNYSDEYRLEIKNIYLRSHRKVLNISYKKYFHLHLAEQIWRYGKDFSQLAKELKFALFD